MVKTKIQRGVDKLIADALIPESEQPYDIPENWVWVKLGSIIDINMGQSPKGALVNDNPEGYPLVGGPKDMGEIYPIVSRYTEKPTKLVEINDIIITVRATIGKTNIADKEYCIGRGVAALRSVEIEQTYILDYLKTVVEYFYSISTGTTFTQISKIHLYNTHFPLPPLNEQKRIVTKLSGMLEKLKQAKELIQEAKDSFEKRRAAILHLAFTGELTKQFRGKNSNGNSGLSNLIALNEIPYVIPTQWKWVLLKDICEKPQYGTSSKSNKDGKIPVVRMGNIQNGNIDWNDLVYSSDEAEIAKYNLEHNDVLFNRTNSPALVGKTAIYKSGMPAIFAGYLIRLKAKEVLSPDYLNYYLNSPYAKMKCQEVKTDGVNQSNINSTKLSNFEFPLPTKEEQIEIVRILDDLLGKETEALALLKLENEIDLLEKSILSKAFRGDLDTNDPEDEPAGELLKRILQEKQKKEATTKKKSSKRVTIKAKPIEIGISAKAKVTVMKEEKKSILDILKESKAAMPAKEVWQNSRHSDDIEKFYAKLKTIEDQLVETKKGKVSTLKLKK